MALSLSLARHWAFLPLCPPRTPIPRAQPFSEPGPRCMWRTVDSDPLLVRLHFHLGLARLEAKGSHPSHPEGCAPGPWGWWGWLYLTHFLECFSPAHPISDVRNAPEEGSGREVFCSILQTCIRYLQYGSHCLDSRKKTEVTKRRSWPLRCLESAVDETDAYMLDKHSVLPSPQESGPLGGAQLSLPLGSGQPCLCLVLGSWALRPPEGCSSC